MLTSPMIFLKMGDGKFKDKFKQTQRFLYIIYLYIRFSVPGFLFWNISKFNASCFSRRGNNPLGSQ